MAYASSPDPDNIARKSIQASSAPTAEGPGVLVSWWWAGSGAPVKAFLVRRGVDMV